MRRETSSPLPACEKIALTTPVLDSHQGLQPASKSVEVSRMRGHDNIGFRTVPATYQ